MRDPLEALREALGWDGQLDAPMEPDPGREARTGVPEVILAEGKELSTVVALGRAFLDRAGRAIVSRASPRVMRGLEYEFREEKVEVHRASRMVVVKRPDYVAPSPGGRVGILTAGTSDWPRAEEAQVIAQEMGCETYVAGDVGVAGIHRLMRPLREMQERNVDVIIVAAGMDGALASVVAGLVDVPVIGLPVSRGYGLGGKGIAALFSMLQTCVPGLTVVNVDNGVGAGASAARIALRVAASAGPTAGRGAEPDFPAKTDSPGDSGRAAAPRSGAGR